MHIRAPPMLIVPENLPQCCGNPPDVPENAKQYCSSLSDVPENAKQCCDNLSETSETFKQCCGNASEASATKKLIFLKTNLMSINSIDLAKLRNPDFLQFLKDYSNIILANNPTALKVTDQYNAVQIVRKTLEQLFMPERSSPITEDIITLDLRRDNAINGIVANAQSYTYHFDNTNSTAATVLYNYLGSYGAGIARENYTSETAIITNIIADLASKPNLSAAVATLQLFDWVTELDTANQAFNKKYIERTQELATTSTDTMKAKRLEAANAYYDLRNNLDAYFTITKGAEPFATAINQLNALIDQYNKLITGRSSGGDTPTPVPPAEPRVA